MLLAIDTSAGSSVAVVDRVGGIVVEHSSPDSRGHAEVIGTLIAQCLADSGVDVPSLSGVAVGMGPGPFTGLRVGIAAAQAFAFAAGKQVLRVASHDAVAFADLSTGPGQVLVVTDARRREVYWSAYRGVDSDSLPCRVAGPGLARPDDLPSAVPDFSEFSRIDAVEVSAGSLGLLAERMSAAGRPFEGAEPLYLRSPDVTLAAAPKRVS